MTDQDAERVSFLLKTKKELLEKLGFLKHDNGQLQFEVNFRVKTGMYVGYPFKINLDELEIFNKELSEFLSKKLNNKLEEVNKQLEKY